MPSLAIEFVIALARQQCKFFRCLVSDSNAKLGCRNVNAADRVTVEFLSLGGVQDVSL
jgi:hypothetical protein